MVDAVVYVQLAAALLTLLEESSCRTVGLGSLVGRISAGILSDDEELAEETAV